MDWKYVFEKPEEFYEKITVQSGQDSHLVSSELRSKFPNSLEISFDVQSAHHRAVENHRKPMTVIRDSIRQHVLMCIQNSDTVNEALALAQELDKEIDWRVKQYTKCLGNVTKNYREWLENDYRSRLKLLIQKMMYRRDLYKKTA